MFAQTDSQLLKTYAQRRLEPAFAELVRRHVDLVYSAALRMVRDPHLAEDVTQGVFVALAKQAPDLFARATLSGWLHRTAQNIAAQTVRTIERRRAREQEAVAMNELISSAPDAAWEQIEPHLDAALGDLSEVDRDAVLLRYFQKRSAAEIAAILGISDAAAQKRVSRAVERLREVFAKRGVTIGVRGLLLVISAHAVQAAPVGLVATISAAALAGTAVTTSTVIAATTKTIAMTILQKTLVTVTVAVLAGTGIYEAKQTVQLRNQIQTLQQRQAPLTEKIQQLQRERDDATNRLDGLIAENAQLKSSSSEHELLKLRGQVSVASQVAADATAKMQSLRTNSAPSQLEALRNETRAHLNTFFKLANLPPDKADQYVNLEVNMQQRQDERMKALLGGTLSVADAVRQRDLDNQQQQDQRRELLGPDGWDTLQSIADGMRNSAAKNLTDTIQANMGDNPLTQEQSNQLQSAIKAEVVANTIDDTDLFRPVDEWTQMVTAHQQNVLQAASGFLTSAQLGTLQFLEEQNLKLLLQKRELRIKALGIKQ